jgi:hypothetical protein
MERLRAEADAHQLEAGNALAAAGKIEGLLK